MNPTILKQNFLVVKEFINPAEATQLASDFSSFLEKNNCGGDDQCKSPCHYNYLGALQILCDKNFKVGELLGEKVLPCYCYGRDYKNGDALLRHIDRPSCEISLSVHLNGDTEWPLFIETPGQTAVPVYLDPGDAVLYLGTIAPHWREKYTGNSYVQIFLHYVLADGFNNHFYFDLEYRDRQHTHINSLYR